MTMHILRDICNTKRQEIVARRANIGESILLEQAKHADGPRGFIRALRHKVGTNQYGLIAEIKKASPSAGVIREDFHPAELAKAYEQGGAACLSVLTDKPYFQGDDVYLQHAHSAVLLPVLRKDFMLEPYQIIESRALGADCVLLIMACLSSLQSQELYVAAKALGMDILVEVHDHADLEKALTLGADMIGINNRNLKTMAVDLAVAESLAKEIPDTILRVCESGIRTHGDITRMKQSDILCFLVGESLMRHQNVAQATRELLGNGHG